MCRRGGMVDTAACQAVERKLVGVRIPLAKSQAFPSWEGFYVLPKICFVCYLPTLQMQVPPWTG